MPRAPPLLHFREVFSGINFNGQFPGSDLWYIKHHKVIVASDGWTLFAIDPEAKSCTKVYDSPSEHAISAIHPKTGDVILTIWGQGREHHPDFGMVNVRTHEMTRLHPHQMASPVPPWGLLVIDDEHQLLFMEDYSIVKVSTSGRCEFIEACLPRRFGMAPNADGIFYHEEHAIMALFFRDMSEAVTLAGSPKQCGVKDGVGVHARFTQPGDVCVNSRSVFAWSLDLEREQSRLTSVDLTTLNVETLNVTGIDEESEWILYCASDTEFFALDPGSDWFKEKSFTLYAAALPQEESMEPSMCAAVSSLDWQQPIEQVTFKLANGEQLFVDKRFLVARSPHHNVMMSSGFAEASTKCIDLSVDKDATKESLKVLLNFIHADVWAGRDDDLQLTLQVRKLADKYEFPHLVRLAEDRLYRLINHQTVLHVLTELDGSRTWLEDWCWRVLDREIEKIMPKAEAHLDDIITKHPKLAKKMLQHFALPRRQRSASGCCRVRPY